MPPKMLVAQRPILRLALFATATVVAAGLSAAPTAVAGPLDEADGTVQALREDADRAANTYFDALGRAAALDTKIERLERRLPDLARRQKRLTARAAARAVGAYKRAGVQLATLLDSSDALMVARRRELLGQLNAHDHRTFARLSALTRRIEARRHKLRAARAAHETALAELAESGRDIDAKLQAALDRRNLLEAEAAAAATPAPAPAPPPPEVTAPPTTAAAPDTVPTEPPPGYEPTPGTHPRHDEPFLTCTRARESGGNYQAVNPAGPYLGAYQFLQSTWNGGANHAGRLDLVNVPPNTASEYDQDHVAWAVYKWKGSAPWVDDCPSTK